MAWSPFTLVFPQNHSIHQTSKPLIRLSGAGHIRRQTISNWLKIQSFYTRNWLFLDLHALLQALAYFVSLSHSSLGISVFPVAISSICSALIQTVCNYFLPTLEIHLRSLLLHLMGELEGLPLNSRAAGLGLGTLGRFPHCHFLLYFNSFANSQVWCWHQGGRFHDFSLHSPLPWHSTLPFCHLYFSEVYHI